MDIIQLFNQSITNYQQLRHSSDGKNSFFADLMELLHTLIEYGFCWNLNDNSNTVLQLLINFRGNEVLINLPLLVQMLDGRDENIMIGERGVDVGYSFRQENLSLFRLKVNIIKVLHSFLKQLIYLGLERFLTTFPRLKIEDGEDLTTHDGMKHLFSPFQLYQCFDVATPEGSNLEAVLKYLMCYPNDDLRQASVTLLDDIYKKEHKMFEDARNSYLIFKEDNTFTVFSKMGSFVAFNKEDPRKETNPRLYQQINKPLQALVQGFGDERILENLECFSSSMVTEDNNNVPRRRIQMLAFTCGIFSALMVYVLKFSQRVYHANTNQPPLLNQSFKFLQLMCRGNEKVKAKIFVSIPLLLKVRTGVAAVAHLLAEVFKNNRELCLRISNNDIECMYTLASTYHSDNSEYLEFFKTLGILMKPDTEGSILIHQQFLFRLFLDSYHDCFSDVMSYDDAVILLETSSQDDKVIFAFQRKLLLLTEFLAACSENYQFAKDKCCTFFSLHQLINIITNNEIAKNDLQKPFVCFLVQVYLCNRRQLKCPIEDPNDVISLLASLKQVVSQLLSEEDIKTFEGRPLYQDEQLKELLEQSCIREVATEMPYEEEIEEKEKNKVWQDIVTHYCSVYNGIAVNTRHMKFCTEPAWTNGLNASHLLQLYKMRLTQGYYIHIKKSEQEKLVEIFKECINEIEELKCVTKRQLRGSSEESNIILARAALNFFQIFGVLHQCVIKMNEHHFAKLKSKLQFLCSFSPHYIERLLLSEKEDVGLYVLAFFTVFFLYNGENATDKVNILEIRSVAIGNRNLFNIIGRHIQRGIAELNKPDAIPESSPRLPLPDSHYGSINEDSQSNIYLTHVHVDHDEVPEAELEVGVTDLIWQAGLSLDVISAMCSGKNDEMQDKMRLDPSTGICFVRDIAIFLRKLAYSGAHSSLIGCKTKAIQALIELCNGNIENKK
ncbi:PREDICTED: uncharacterized protein LOC109583410 [Amphimedon queenslandica]|uniref:Uncharacterized protein n=1 Tax=Amphimedon queenslandica TaxID=400682 RepID=A0AAN0JC29_AMPQE|nr:PREDICTED: uncharacterized protein LOC109583410 [Amphimedon queenslandica]|eukprot:XP_019854296.1 PREDICTED: uncharacterized protein LOC109583410 [Amphimedon queenslandica]